MKDIIILEKHSDQRGDLYVIEESDDFIFDFKSFLLIDKVQQIRCQIYLLVIRGSIVYKEKEVEKARIIFINDNTDIIVSRDFIGLLFLKNTYKAGINPGFQVKRIFFVDNIPVGSIRGQHAHKTESQHLVCIDGGVDVELSGFIYEKKHLHSFDTIHLPPLLWTKLTNFEEKTILLVFASSYYLQEEYINDKKDLNFI